MRNRSLARSLATSSLIAAVAATGLLAVSSASASDPIYHWKDSTGQSHYSQSMPEKGIKYEVISSSGAPASGSTTTAANGETPAASGKAAPASSPAANAPTTADAKRAQQCEAAKRNVEILETRPLVTMDINNTGTPKTLTPQEQRDQLAHFKAVRDALCVK